MGGSPVDLDALLVRIDDLVRSHGAVPRADLRSIKRHLPAIGPGLIARGYEIGSSIRLPLEKQLLEQVLDGFVLKKGLERRVAGASAREVKDAVQRLVAKGALVEVVRESGAGLVGSTGDAIDPSEIEELLRRLVKIEKLARRARSTRGAKPSLLRLDVAGPLARWTDPARAHIPEPRGAPLLETLTREIRKRFRENRLPIRVPDLLRSMGATAEQGKQALVDGAARGLFELEPESGMGRLSHEDAELCPAGPMGTRLSWVVARDHEEVHR
jgi:hypothetical protein